MLGDLDELVLKCRNEQARQRIGEAVLAYKAGAYRSAVIMTWVALAFDIVEKVRELSVSGDAAATLKIEEYERIHRDGDVLASLKFERSLLEAARKEFELFSDSEHIELQRIQDDRNRCAHPSQNMDGDPFTPSAELARAHIRAAIEYVLKNEPAQGKHALGMVMKLIGGDYFPLETKKAFEALAHSPLMTGRHSLVRAFMVVVLKAMLRDEVKGRGLVAYVNGLKFVKDKRPDMWQAHFAKELNNISRTLEIREHGGRLLFLITRIPESWAALVPGVRSGLELFVSNLRSDEVVDIDEVLKVPELVRSATLRVEKMTADEVRELVMWETPPQIAKRVVDGLCAAESYAEANAWVGAFNSAFTLSEDSFTRALSDRLVLGVIKNRQLRECNKLNDVLEFIVARGYGNGEDWDRMLVLTERTADDLKP